MHGPRRIPGDRDKSQVRGGATPPREGNCTSMLTARIPALGAAWSILATIAALGCSNTQDLGSRPTTEAGAPSDDAGDAGSSAPDGGDTDSSVPSLFDVDGSAN